MFLENVEKPVWDPVKKRYIFKGEEANEEEELKPPPMGEKRGGQEKKDNQEIQEVNQDNSQIGEENK